MDELQKILVNLLVVALTAATPILVGMLVQYLRKQLKKVGLEATEQELETIRMLALEGIAYAAQRAKVEFKTTEKKLSGKEKKDLALEFARKLATKYKVSDESMDVLDGVIEATLARGVIDG